MHRWRVTTGTLVTVALSVCGAPAWGIDEETTRLERMALCQAMPYQCPKGAAQTTAKDWQANDARTMAGATPPTFADMTCPDLVRTARVLRDKQRWHVPLTQTDTRDWQTWTRHCARWFAELNEPEPFPRVTHTFSAPRPSSSAFAASHGITTAGYAAVQLGMSYAEVVAILGPPSHTVTQTESSFVGSSAVYAWTIRGRDGYAKVYLGISFQGDKVYSKTQNGLR